MFYIFFYKVHEELVQAIKDAEEGLFHLKRARLLQEADLALQSTNDNTAEDVKVEPIDPTEVEAESLEDQSYSVGSKCRFRHIDGRWYNGLIVGLEGSNAAKISYLTPTSENMLVCISFLFPTLLVSLQPFHLIVSYLSNYLWILILG